jgi:hypothetical protein
LRYPKRAYTFSVDYFSTPESVDPHLLITSLAFGVDANKYGMDIE